MTSPISGFGGEPVAGRYRLVREVGRGGMGSVWLAHDEVLGRDVALKRLGLFPGHDSPDLERAEREARLAAQLSHPNVVTVFDLAVEGEERWLVMEYVEGTTLAHLASARGGLPGPEVASIIRQAAEALQVAHEAGIVHRDVKPSNLIVGHDGVTKLADFGIARGASDATLTQAGVLTGSPAYLAPEVAAGGSATAASDVWSLGGALYQALTGRPPYDLGDNIVAGLLRIVREDPPRLPGAGRLGTVLAATMVRDPAQRWTAAQVAGYLDGHLSEDTQPLAPVPAGPPTGPPATAPAAAPPTPAPTAVLAAAPPGPPPGTPTGPPTGPPPPRRPAPPDRPATRPMTRRRGTPYWAITALLAAVLLLGGWMLLRPSADDPEASAGADTTAPRTPPPSETATASRPSESATSAAGPTAAQMREFVQDYLATVTRDPGAAWAMLTPEFQQASGGFGDYKKFWAPIRSATPSAIVADPRTLTISYHVAYDGPASRPGSDDVRLRLRHEDGHLRIAGEPE